MFPCKFMYFIHLLADSYYSLNYLKKKRSYMIFMLLQTVFKKYVISLQKNMFSIVKSKLMTKDMIKSIQYIVANV